MQDLFLSPPQLAALACQLEVAAPKPGNVHRGADFEDAHLIDFLFSASLLADQLQKCERDALGGTIQQCVRATRQYVGNNTNLGMILLLVPLVKLSQRQLESSEPTTDGVRLCPEAVDAYLSRLTPEDSQMVFAAIAEARPGGLGKSEAMDVQDPDGPADLMQAMRYAADRDAIARQYTHGMRDVFERGVPWLLEGVERFSDISQAIVFAHVQWMSFEPDSLIRRKCGLETALNAQRLASQARDAIRMDSAHWDPDAYWGKVGELDFWLRSDGHRRNPGTTADLIAASLYVALVHGQIQPPFPFKRYQ